MALRFSFIYGEAKPKLAYEKRRNNNQNHRKCLGGVSVLGSVAFLPISSKKLSRLHISKPRFYPLRGNIFSGYGSHWQSCVSGCLDQLAVEFQLIDISVVT